MKVIMKKGCCIVRRTKDDPTFKDSEWGSAESQLLYRIKGILNKRGYELIKKRMWRDGHLMDDNQLYLRTKKPSGKPSKDIYIYNSNWAVEGAEVDFNKKGETVLTVVTGVFVK
jgi:hypothetical protein